MGLLIGLLILAILALIILSSCVKIVPQAQALVVERLGAYQGTWSCRSSCQDAPFLDRVAKRVNLKEQVVQISRRSR